MSWNLTGVRVLLGSTPHIEKRTNWVAFVIVTETRTVTTDRAEWRGLSQAGAIAKTATATWTIKSRDAIGPSGQWRVVEEKETAGAWS